MATKKLDESDALTPAPRNAVKLRKFAAPDQLAEKFGVDTQQEGYVSGFVQTEDVRELLDAFGLNDRQQVTFPFQHIKKQHGEVWRMRIEPSAGHTVGGTVTNAHHWIFMCDIPERVGGPQ